MLLADLHRESSVLDSQTYQLYGTPHERFCRYAPMIVICLRIVRAMIPPLFSGYVIKGNLLNAIIAIQNQCPSETKENPNLAGNG